MTPMNVYPFEFSHGGGPFVVLPTEVVKNYF